jgi:hypothetical protein
MPDHEVMYSLRQELQDSVSIDSVSDGSVQLRKGRRRASHRRGFSHLHGIPVPKLDYDLPADFGELVLRSRPAVSTLLTLVIGGSSS